MLTKDELERYDRQIMIDGFGEEGQEKLKRAKVFIAGAGGLGSTIALYLTVAGVGTIRIVDHDKVELSNLNRQILHWDKDVGRKKINSTLEKLEQINAGVKIEAIEETISESNVSQLVADSDLIVDAMDNLPTRYILNKTALERKIPFFHGAVRGVTTIIPGQTACLMCIYRGHTPPQEKFPVIGVTPAVIGCIQATETVKYIVGIGELLTNRLLTFSGLDMKFTEFKVSRDPNCKHCSQLGKT